MALEQAIRADERAKGAHERLDRNDTALAELRSELGHLRDGVASIRVAVGKLNVKVALAAAIASMIGSGIVGLIVVLLGRKG